MDGILIVDKPPFKTSRDIVNTVCKKFNTKKVGHMGTLDPMATGVLVLAVGKATKIISLLDKTDKDYIASVVMGYQTDTLDVTGTKIEEKELTKVYDIQNTLKKFEITYLQEVPKYSATRIKGKHLYEYARKDLEVVLPKKEVTIKKINLISSTKNEFSFFCTVSKGTYIRSLIRDIGVMLDMPCTMKSLNRTRQGNFTLEKAYTLSEIEELPLNKISLLSIEDALSDYKTEIVTSDLEFKIINGVRLNYKITSDYILFKNEANKLLAIYQKDGEFIKSYYVFRDTKKVEI